MKRLGLILVVIASVACAIPAASAATTWRIVPTPTPAGTVLSALNAVSCLGADSCTAVGYYGVTHNGSVDRALAEHWNGSAWAIQPTPTPAGGGLLTGVSCVSRRLCVAVGQGERGIYSEFWDGAAWRVVAMPQPAGMQPALNGVSCGAPSACMAVGMVTDASANQAPIAEWWNGTSWQLVPPRPVPSPFLAGALNGVSCLSATACTAVGEVTNGVPSTWVQRWNGSKWEVQSTPSEGESFLEGVSCPVAGDCTAVGGAFGISSGAHIDPLAEQWSAGVWRERPIPALPGIGGFDDWLSGVSCAAASACTAVGFDNNALTLAEAWDGSAWTRQTTPNPAGATQAQLNGVSCHPAAVCTAVGLADFFGGSQGLAETTG